MKTKRTIKRSSSGDPLLRRYRAALREQRTSKADAEAFARIEIVPPAVRPKDVSRATIRKAVREAMRKYVEKYEAAEGT